MDTLTIARQETAQPDATSSARIMGESAKLLFTVGEEAHLWLTFLPKKIEPSVRRSWWELLSAQERARHDRLRVERARHQHLAAWALARTSLSRYADVAPEEWEFSRGRYGRPEIAAPQGLPRLRFNLSHSNGLVVCLVTLELDAGVDVESLQRDREVARLADRFFSADEAADVRALEGASRRERFFAYWTLKEAYLKARGRGLTIPLRRASFRIAAEGAVELSFDARLEDREGDWQLAVLRPSEQHLLSLAIRRGERPDLPLITRESLPGSGDDLLRSLAVVASTPARL